MYHQVGTEDVYWNSKPMIIFTCDHCTINCENALPSVCMDAKTCYDIDPATPGNQNFTTR